MKNQIGKQIIGCIWLCIAAVILFLFIFALYKGVRDPSRSMVDFTEGWTDLKGNPVDIHDFGEISEERFTIQNTMPKSITSDEALNFYSYNVNILVEVGGRSAYRYEPGTNITGKGYGEAFHDISLNPTLDKGKRITMRVEPIFPKETSGLFSEMKICTPKLYFEYWLMKNGLAFIISMIVVLCGLGVLLYGTVILSKRQHNIYNLPALAVMLICLGFWTAIETKVPLIVCGASSVLRLGSYIYLMLVIYPTICFINSMTVLRRTRYEVIGFLLFAADLFIQLYMRFVLGRDMHFQLKYTHWGMLVGAAVIVWLLVENHRHQKSIGRKDDLGYFYGGAAFVVVGGLADMIYFSTGPMKEDSAKFMRIAMVGFIIMLFLQIMEQLGAERKISNRNHFINEMLRTGLSSSAPERMVMQILEYIGEQMSADHVDIIEGERGGKFSETFEWCRPGYEPTMDEWQDLPYEGGIEFSYGEFEKNGKMVIENPEQVKDRCRELYDRLKETNAERLVSAPLVVDGEYVGIVDIVNLPEKKLEEAESAIGLVQYYISGVLRQRDTQRILRRYSYQDQMTGVMNRRALEEFIKDELAADKPYGVLMVDINGLKKANDTLGHDAGDAMIRDVALCLAEIFHNEQVFRMGGDEFLAVSLDSTENAFEMRVKTFALLLKARGRSASVGGAFHNPGREEFEAVQKAADKKMYADKQAYYETNNIKRWRE